jgi:hypothetical protein
MPGVRRTGLGPFDPPGTGRLIGSACSERHVTARISERSWPGG